MTDVHIVSTYFAEDDRATGAPAAWLDGTDLDVRTLRIRSLGDGWGPDEDDLFGSGAGPIFALRRAIELISDGAEIVRIVGRDMLRTGYQRQERRELMAIYDCSIPEGYTRVALAFMEHHDIDRDTFLELAKALEANCRATARERGLAIDPPGTHDLFVTELFRRVDCAHPDIDFEGEVVLASSSVAQTLGLTGPRVTAVATTEIEDGPANAADIARYAHLRDVIEAVAEQRGRLPSPLESEYALELYTCFPVVPLGFLAAAGWATTPAEMTTLLGERAVTVSGGMNFAKAPWNNPALRALAMVAREVEARRCIGLVHGNGGLGAKQGLCVVEP